MSQFNDIALLDRFHRLYANTTFPSHSGVEILHLKDKEGRCPVEYIHR